MRHVHVPCGIPCRAGYHAVRDTVPCGIPCSECRHHVRETMTRGMRGAEDGYVICARRGMSTAALDKRALRRTTRHRRAHPPLSSEKRESPRSVRRLPPMAAPSGSQTERVRGGKARGADVTVAGMVRQARTLDRAQPPAPLRTRSTSSAPRYHTTLGASNRPLWRTALVSTA